MKNQNKEPPTAGKVFISFYKDIRTFYVVNEKFLNYENEWFKVCELEAKKIKNRLTDIKPDEIYLVNNKLDQRYYRVLLQEIRSDCCKVKFIDYGNELKVRQEQLAKCPDMLKSCKPRAQECTFFNIKWNTYKEKNKALACVAGERRLFQMYTIGQVNNILLIDLITLEGRRFSLRDFLLSYSIGVVDKSIELPAAKDVQELVETIKSNHYQEGITKRSLKLNNCYEVKIRQVYSPDEFYVCDTKDLDAEAELQIQMKEFYTILTPQMYGPIAVRSFYAIQLTDDSWHRIEVLEKCDDNGSCSILFIDIGMIHNEISVSKLLLLDSQFYNFKRMAIKCSMANVTPINEDSWNKEAIQLLKYALEYVQESEIIRIKVVRNIYGIDRLSEVTVEITKESIIINVNASLVHLNHATTETVQAPFRRNDDYVMQEEEYKPIAIDILSIDEAKPDGFYFAYTRFAGGIENIRNLIQVKMETSKRTLIEWKEDDQCMVYYREVLGKPIQYWYRGVIEKINSKLRKCCVFLCERGTRVVCSLSLLRQCPDEFKDIPNSCARAHLPCTPLDASSWSRETIKMFRNILKDFNNFSITIPDNTAKGNSTCVILWGQKRDEPLNEQINYYNIIKVLVSAGIAEANDLFQHNYSFSVDYRNDVTELVDGLSKEESYLDLLQFETSHVMVLEYKVELKKRQIVDWIPANNTKKVFIGLPTYVDNNSIISMNDEAEEYYVKMIKKILNKYYHDNTQRDAHTFTVGEPCIVRYFPDGLYYRGTIVGVLENSAYDVKFIDFGNTARCNETDIFNKVMCSELPTMSYTLQLPSLNIRVNQTLNDALHSLIVDKICNISVSAFGDTNLAPFCSISVENLKLNSFQDVINYLIN